jgi:outer membrane receptor protein involved in Fe transport
VTVGTELTRSDVTSDAFGIHAEDAYAAYAEGEQPLGAGLVRVTAGARVDLLNVDGGSISAVVSPRIGAVVPKGRLVWRASAGRGFRAPSLAERFVQTSLAGITVIPNPDLVPESAWSFELGNFAQVASRLTTDVALFWTEASNLIEPSVANGAEIQFRNVTRARLAGVDAALAFFPFTQRLGLKLAYTLLYAEQLAHDTVPEQPLAFRPRHLVTAAADYRLGRFTAGGDFRFMSRYERVELYPPSDPILAPKVLDLRARYDIGMLSVLLRAQNVFNYIYNLVPQQLAPVRAVSVTATVSY